MIEEAYDCAKIFNTTSTGNQMPIGTLCSTYLNLDHKKKSGPAFAFTEAKIAMALYKQWLRITSGMASKEQKPATAKEVDQVEASKVLKRLDQNSEQARDVDNEQING